VNDRLDNRSFVLIAGERLRASIDSHTAGTTTSVTSPTERTSMFASRNPLSAWSCGPSPRSARCSTCPRPRRSRIPSRHGRQWSERRPTPSGSTCRSWSEVRPARLLVQAIEPIRTATSGAGRARELPPLLRVGAGRSATVLPASHGRPSSPSPERAWDAGRPTSQFGLSACAVQLDTVELELGRGARHCQFA
jgi:hypothetical protein